MHVVDRPFAVDVVRLALERELHVRRRFERLDQKRLRRTLHDRELMPAADLSCSVVHLDLVRIVPRERHV